MVKARWVVAWAGYSSGKDSRLSFVFEGERGTSFETLGRGSSTAEQLQVQLCTEAAGSQLVGAGFVSAGRDLLRGRGNWRHRKG
jgi:hypothetical protein